MIRTVDMYRRTEMPNVYREELCLVCFAESPHRDPLEVLFDDQPPAYCRVCYQPSGSLKISSSSQEFFWAPSVTG